VTGDGTLNYKGQSKPNIGVPVDGKNKPSVEKPRIERPNVFAYTNAHELLTDWFTYLSFKDSKLSLRYISSISGLSPGFLSFILSGKRAFSDKAFDKLSSHLQMKNEEIAYLNVIRKLTGTYSHEVKAEAFEISQKLKAHKDECPEATETYNYLSHWLHVAIRELAQLKGFKIDPIWIKMQLNFDASTKDIRGAVDFLIENRLVVKKEDGTYGVSLKSIGCNDDVFLLAINNYHKEMLQLAYDAQVDMSGISNRALSGHTLSLSKKQYAEIVNLMSELDKKIREIEVRDDGDKELVTQVEVAVFNIAEIKKRGQK